MLTETRPQQSVGLSSVLHGAQGDRFVALGLVALGVVAAGARFNDRLVGLTGDNAAYILLSRGMLTGQPYNNPEYPWGYPALLAPVLAVVGPAHLTAALPWLKLITIALYLAALPVIYLLFRQRHPPLPAVIPPLFFAVNNVAILHAEDVMTEMPYTLASFTALLLWLRLRPDRPSADESPGPRWGALAMCVVPALCAYYLRTVGVALLAAIPAVLVWRRQIVKAAVAAAAIGLAALPWVLYSSSLSQGTYLSKLLLRDPYNPSAGQIGSLWEFIARLADTASLYMGYVFSHTLFPDPTPDRLRDLLAPLLALLIVGGLLLRLARRVDLPEVYCILYMLVIFAWPWRADRFMLPVYPLLIHYAVTAIYSVWGLVRARVNRLVVRQVGVASAAAMPLVLLAALPNLIVSARESANNLRFLAGDPQASIYTPDWERYFEACRWLSEHTPPGSISLSRKSTLTIIYSDRESYPIPLIAPNDYPGFLNRNGIGYIIEDAFVWSTQTNDYLRPALRAYPDMFRLEASTAPPRVNIWRVVR